MIFNALRLGSNSLRAFQSYTKLTINSIRINRTFLTTLPRPNGELSKIAKTNLLTPKRLSLNAVTRYCSNSKTTVDKSKRIVGYWLLGCSGMVFVAVILGVTLTYIGILCSICYVLSIVITLTGRRGVTRLTESGLSMVTWKLLGEKRPSNDAEWIEEFERYKQYPEFKLKNSNMTVQEFKVIWLMEYGHRMWGRGIGAFFAIPAIYFWTKGYFAKGMKFRVLAFGTLIGLQGLMGWYMVKSGLEDRFNDENDVPRVSQYRLASHLSAAFVLYTLFLWSALDHLIPAQPLSGKVTAAALNFRKFAHVTKGMIFLTAVSGAFVAGLDAGLTYNSFPKMADRWIPTDILAMSPTLKNFTENPTTVQFDHRILGTVTLTLISGLYILSRRRILPPKAYKAATAVAIMGWTQVILGISTLLMYVPVSLAACHQSGSLILLSMAVWLTHELKYLKKIPK